MERRDSNNSEANWEVSVGAGRGEVLEGGYFWALTSATVEGDDGVGVRSYGWDDVGGLKCGWGHGCFIDID